MTEMLTVKAPAKINLTLEVLGKRPDGFHEIRSVIQAVSLCDTLRLERAGEIVVTADMPEWKAGESLVSRAVELLREETGYSGGVRVRVEKQIPLMSGLGGDSSDAAAVLRGLNTLWELNLPGKELQKLARELGSDVFFFLRGGTALVEGRGEIVKPLPPLPRLPVVLAVPPVEALPGKTGRMYASLEPGHFTDGGITRRLLEVLETGGEPEPSLLFNTFENVAFSRFSGLETARAHFIKLGAPFAHLAGSGPALYTFVETPEKAGELGYLLEKQRIKAFAVETTAG
jgi:4-diphosphocytidyl-2-C-methyl-D-erythritol kinase